MKRIIVGLLAAVIVIGACSPATQTSTPQAVGANGREETTEPEEISTQQPTSPRPTAPKRVKVGDLLFFATYLDLESNSVEDSWSEIYTVSAEGKDLSCLTCSLEEMTVTTGSNSNLSPDRSMIVFSMAVAIEDNIGPMIYILNIGTQKLRPVVFGTNPIWSPDGKRFAFQAQITHEIYLSDMEGNALCVSCEFEDQPGYYEVYNLTTLSWSPDGKWILFVANTDDGQRVIKISSDGTTWSDLTGYQHGTNTYPTWSPDGELIAYTLTYIPQTLEYQTVETWVMESDGSSPICVSCGVTQIASENVVYSVNLGWSPNGSKLIFGTVRGENHQIGMGESASRFDIYVTTINREPQMLISLDVNPKNYQGFRALWVIVSSTWPIVLPYLEGPPAWSPDGSKIAFASAVDGSYEIFVMDSDGSNLRQITDTPDQDEHSPFWLR